MITESTLHFYLILAGFGLAAVVFVSLFFISAPYGRHARQGWGPTLPNHIGWLLMEAPSALLFALYFFTGAAPKTLPLLVFFGLWEAHYVHRAFIYPLTIRDGHKKMPLTVLLLGVLFNSWNAFLNGRYLFTLSGGYPAEWVRDPRFVAGVTLFAAGYITNRWADTALRRLRKPGEEGYRIPNGGLFHLVSCPNYLGEIVEWAGWALATWSLAGLGFAAWTFANLAPRARSHHAWYRQHFPEYPVKRRALIPGWW
jgi:protein-S-isoprenylcysteine O-methyltransferase Ste14